MYVVGGVRVTATTGGTRGSGRFRSVQRDLDNLAIAQVVCGSHEGRQGSDFTGCMVALGSGAVMVLAFALLLWLLR